MRQVVIASQVGAQLNGFSGSPVVSDVKFLEIGKFSLDSREFEVIKIVGDFLLLDS